MMKTEERLKTRVELQQRYLRFCGKTGTRVMVGVGTTAYALAGVALLLATPGRPPMTRLLLFAIPGGLFVAVSCAGSMWLSRKFLRSQIGSLQRKIETLERED